MQNSRPMPTVSNDAAGDRARFAPPPRLSAARPLLPYPEPGSRTSSATAPIASGDFRYHGQDGQPLAYAVPPGQSYPDYGPTAPPDQQGQASFAVQVTPSAPIPLYSAQGDRFYSYQAENRAEVPYNTGPTPSPVNRVDPGLVSTSPLTSLASAAYPAGIYTNSPYHLPSHIPPSPQHVQVPAYHSAAMPLPTHQPPQVHETPSIIASAYGPPVVPAKRSAAQQYQDRVVLSSTPGAAVDLSGPAQRKRRRQSTQAQQQGPPGSVLQLQQQQSRQRKHSRKGPYGGARPKSVRQRGYHSPTQAVQQRSTEMVSSASPDSHTESNEPLLQARSARRPTGQSSGGNVASARTDATLSERTFGEHTTQGQTTGLGRMVALDDESRPRRKREREKRRRENMKAKFVELQRLVMPGASGRNDKESILGETVEEVKKQRRIIAELHVRDEARLAEIAEFRQEKSEMRADKKQFRAQAELWKAGYDRLFQKVLQYEPSFQDFLLGSLPTASSPLMMQPATADPTPAPSFTQAQSSPISTANWEARTAGADSTRFPSNTGLHRSAQNTPGAQQTSDSGRTTNDNNSPDNNFSSGPSQ